MRDNEAGFRARGISAKLRNVRSLSVMRAPMSAETFGSPPQMSTVVQVLAERISLEQLTLADLRERIGTEITVDMPSRKDGSWQRVVVDVTERLVAALESQNG